MTSVLHENGTAATGSPACGSSVFFVYSVLWFVLFLEKLFYSMQILHISCIRLALWIMHYWISVREVKISAGDGRAEIQLRRE